MLVDIESSLNVLPKGALDRLDCEGLVLKPSDIMVKAFDRSKRMVHREVDLHIKVGSQVFNSTFYVMDICPTYTKRCGYIHITPKVEVPGQRENCHRL